MRQCNFCSRWFGNKQAVRRHLGYCTTYRSAPRPQRPPRVALFQCVGCVQSLGTENTVAVTAEEMHEQAALYRGCQVCGGADWQRSGWRLQEAAPSVHDPNADAGS